MREYDKDYEIAVRREYKVVKANEIIQHAKNDLSLPELKILAYCISMIKPNDEMYTVYEFSIQDYCRVCGLDASSGKHYAEIKKTFTGLLEKCFWMLMADGSEVSVHWLQKVSLNRGRGRILVRFDEDLQKYVFGLFENYTQYELLYTLPMTSQYSFRLYELLKSYAFTKKHCFDLQELKRLLNAVHYENFKDFRRKVLEVAIREINLFTDLEVSYEPIYKGRKVIQIVFHIKVKNMMNQLQTKYRAHDMLDGQMTIEDFLDE